MYWLKITFLGQCFVACSRVRNISGLHLMNFETSAVITDPICILEYNRLRKTIGLGPLDIPRKVEKRRQSSTKKQKPPTAETATPIAAVVSIRRPSRRVADENIESEADTQESLVSVRRPSRRVADQNIESETATQESRDLRKILFLYMY